MIKRGVRVLGVAESFIKGAKCSVISGVVMRGDLQIDGFSFATATVGGMDATQSILRLYENLKRKDINVIMLNGCVISWFNIVDLEVIHAATAKPLIAVTYEESEGLENYLRKYFDDWEERLAVYRRLGERQRVTLHTGHQILIRCINMTVRKARLLLNRFTLQGAVPEPLRVARILSRSILRSGLVSEATLKKER
ncbi:MAG: DUF99 family protein [Candidatus Jordarchaeales archaeon]|nr:DUF99 family protein [Candidatus Jordarchaeia archaeon]